MSERRFSEILKAIDEVKAKTLVEIGVYRCERSRAMIKQALKHNKSEDIYFYGFDLFEYMTKELSSKEVSRSSFPYSSNHAKALLEKEFPKVNIKMFAGDSKDTLANVHIAFDVAFIDGGHSYETTKSDWLNIRRMMKPESIVLIDDYSEIPGVFTTQVVDEIDETNYDITLSMDMDMSTPAYGFTKINIAKIKRINHGNPISISA